IAVSVGLVAASVSLRHTPMLGLGVAGLFAFSVWAIGYYFGETMGTPLVLLVARVVLLAVAFVAARLRGLTSERSSPHPKRGPDRPSSCRTPNVQPGMSSN